MKKGTPRLLLAGGVAAYVVSLLIVVDVMIAYRVLLPGVRTAGRGDANVLDPEVRHTSGRVAATTCSGDGFSGASTGLV